MYSALAHAESEGVAKQLSRIYGETRDDLHLVRETLCDPFLHSVNNNEDSLRGTNNTSSSTTSVALASYKEKAELLANTLNSISSCE
jgi:hypothetical protein